MIPKGSVWKGHLAMLFANMVWGAMSPISKFVTDAGVDGIALSAIRIAGGALLFILFSLILPKSVLKREKVERKDLIKLFVASLLIISANQAMYIVGISFTSPIDSSVMSTLTPVFTMIFAAVFIAIPISFMKSIGVALGLGGALMLVFSGSNTSAEVTNASNPILGDSLCLVAQICAALYYVKFTGLINKYSAFTLMKWMYLFSAITYVPCTLPWIMDVNFNAFTVEMWGAIAYIIIFASFVGYLLIPYSQKVLKPTTVSMYTYFQPTTAALLTAVMGLGDFGALKILATGLIFVGVWFVSQSRGKLPSQQE